MKNQHLKVMKYFAVISVILIVGALDYFTGADIQILSLYLVPLGYAGWNFGRIGSITIALLGTIVWLVIFYLSGAHYQHGFMVINFLTQGTAFLTFTILTDKLAALLQKSIYISRTDFLTGLNNRQSFTEQASTLLSLCKRHARPVALAYIDLDNFKNVNDMMGHDRGDNLLKIFGKLISESLRASDIPARLGGDEFVILLPETNSENATLLLENILKKLEQTTEFQKYGLSASIGVAVDETASYDIQTLLTLADRNMYTVKKNGKNQVKTEVLTSANLNFK